MTYCKTRAFQNSPRFLILFLAVFCFAVSSVSAYGQGGAGIAQRQEAEFFDTIDDLPLMPGLKEIPSESVYFDKPEGRIIEAFAEMHHVSQKDVLLYYQGSLPQFGWGRVNDQTFFRDQEQLEISFTRQNNHQLVKILVKPLH